MLTIGVTESIVNHLRDQIIMGELAPGARLNEMEIATGVGISRAPLREAFRVLENDHLIVRQPRRGCYVAERSGEHLEKLYEARSMIESFAIDVLESRNLRTLPRLEESLDAMSGTAVPPVTDRHGRLEYLKTLTQFHTRLIEETDNHWAIGFYQSINLSLTRYQFICLYIPGLTVGSSQMHEKILDSIKKGQYRLAKDDLLFHINHTALLIKREIQGREGAVSKLEPEGPRLLRNAR